MITSPRYESMVDDCERSRESTRSSKKLNFIYVFGPPGSGKSTFCRSAYDFYTKSLGRKAFIFNMDPGSSHLPLSDSGYDFMTIGEITNITKCMLELKIGPNNAMVHCVEELAKNLHIFIKKLHDLDENTFVLCDLPGQVEICTHETSVSYIIQNIREA
ncbi:MAG: GPN-loop GTPase 2, partial [Marteilia pararefringens]